ncbi:MAG: helix-turn-helix transcriptional regulator [Clostridia bacterium]|nr:helix-turn-helix transcriptional regulator [Clostridia bacterium]
MAKQKKERTAFCELIKKKGFTRYSLGKALGLSATHVYQWAYGKQNPTIEHLIKMKKLLNVSGDEILEMFRKID